MKLLKNLKHAWQHAHIVQGFWKYMKSDQSTSVVSSTRLRFDVAAAGEWRLQAASKGRRTFARKVVRWERLGCTNSM